MRQINDIPQITPETKEDIKLYSYIKHHVSNMEFGSVQFTLTVKAGKVTMIRKTLEEETYALQNGK